VLAQLRDRRIEYMDVTACLSRLSPTELFIQGRPHYAATGNRAVADCLLPKIIEVPAQRERGNIS
jgi:hypothetical protein